jgi:CRP/FNR family cyclic AMP-dependent transcriptional regulator
MDFPSCYLVQDLSDEQLNRFAAIANETSMVKGQWIYQEGNTAEQVFILKKGIVEMITMVNGDIELPVSVFRSPGDCFGTSSLIEPHIYSLSARCQEDSTVLAITWSDLHKLMEQDRELGCVIMTNLAEQLLSRLKETRQELKLHFKNLLQFMHS